MSREYEVTVSCMFFDMENPEDAVGAMLAWLSNPSDDIQCEVTDVETGESWFIDGGAVINKEEEQ